MFDEQTEALERLVIIGKLSSDQKQVKGYSFKTDLKVELRKTDLEERNAGKPIEKHIVKRVGKTNPVKPRTLAGKVPNLVED